MVQRVGGERRCSPRSGTRPGSTCRCSPWPSRSGLPSRRIGLAVSGAADVVSAAARSSSPARVVAAGANLGFAFVATSATLGARLAGADRGRPRRGLPDRAADDRRLVPRDRGVAIGTLIGALTVGSALPHLIRALGASAGADWQAIVAAASVSALVGAVVVGIGHRTGPARGRVVAVQPGDRGVGVPRVVGPAREPRLSRPHVGALRDVDVAAAVRRRVVRGRRASRIRRRPVRPSFAIVAIGGVGCVVAGALADRLGRTTLTIAAMAGSGASALVAGLVFGAPPAVVTLVGLAWGLTVIADSAQFSAAVSELSPPGTSGSALSFQLALGFLLTARGDPRRRRCSIRVTARRGGSRSGCSRSGRRSGSSRCGGCGAGRRR